MRQFTALLKKEISSYFKSYFAYMIVFIYLSVSIGSAFYFGAYLAMHDNTVYSLFYIQPVILTLLVPALTMRLWSDEYKLGTAEFLFTQPIANKLPVLAKFMGAFILFCLMSLFLLPFIFYTAEWLKIDWTGVLCGYIGLWLFAMLFCALGCFISSLSKYTVISYLLTVFVSGLWLLLPYTKLYDIYNNYLFAEVGISDMAYFLFFVAVILGLNTLVLNYRRSALKNKSLHLSGFVFLAVSGVVILNIAMFLLFDAYKFDFTGDGRYTLDKSSKEIISSIDKPITIDVYISKDLKSKSADYYYYFQQTKRFIEKYQDVALSPIKVNITEVEPFSDLEKMVLSKGLFYEENAKGTKDYFGAILRDNNGQGVVIKQFLPQRRAFMEKDIDKALLKLTHKEVIKSVGIYFDPMQNLGVFNAFSLDLENDYNVLSVSEDTYEISSKLDLLILVNPKELSSSFMYAIDQYMANGGNILIFFDLMTGGQSDETNLKTPQIVAFLDQMKIMLGENMVDVGEAVGNYKISERPLNLYKAITFSADEKEFAVEPVINNKKGYIGAVFSGRYKSAFAQNPYQTKEMIRNMMPHTLYGSEKATIAFIGDADIIENETWVADNSPDENPYSVIEKSANMQVVRRLIDKLAGNDIYNNLKVNNGNESVLGIGEQINAALYEAHYTEYTDILDSIKINRLKLLQKSGGDANEMQKLMQIDKIGMDLGTEEQKLQSLFYEIRKSYTHKINSIIAYFVFALPLCATLLLGLIFALNERRKRRKIKEIFNE